mmetsp:Transcript_22166/g.43104  ORF Transcript_22166/g.43104 Transcript_22166/m.43104 type:complete len:319 (-) Transcript_22166:441-1397(-)
MYDTLFFLDSGINRGGLSGGYIKLLSLSSTSSSMRDIIFSSQSSICSVTITLTSFSIPAPIAFVGVGFEALPTLFLARAFRGEPLIGEPFGCPLIFFFSINDFFFVDFTLAIFLSGLLTIFSALLFFSCLVFFGEIFVPFVLNDFAVKLLSFGVPFDDDFGEANGLGTLLVLSVLPGFTFPLVFLIVAFLLSGSLAYLAAIVAFVFDPAAIFFAGAFLTDLSTVCCFTDSLASPLSLSVVLSSVGSVASSAITSFDSALFFDTPLDFRSFDDSLWMESISVGFAFAPFFSFVTGPENIVVSISVVPVRLPASSSVSDI